MNEKDLEQISSTAKKAKTNVDNLTKSLTNVDKGLTGIYAGLEKIEKISDLNKISQSVNILEDITNKTITNTSKLGKSLLENLDMSNVTDKFQPYFSEIGISNESKEILQLGQGMLECFSTFDQGKIVMEDFNPLISNIVELWKSLNTESKIWTSIGLVSDFVNLYNEIENLFDLSEIVTLFSDFFGIFSKFGSVINPISLLIGALVIGLGSICLTNDEIKESIDNIIKTFINNLQPILSFFSNHILPDLKKSWDEFIVILQPFTDFLNSAFTSIWKDILIPIFQFLGETVLPNIIETFKNLWNQILQPFVEFLNSILRPIIEILSDKLNIVWKNIMIPFSEFLVTVFSKAWESIYTIFNNTLIPIINGVMKVLKSLWDNILTPLIEFLYNTFKPSFENVCEVIGEVFSGLKKVFSGVLDFITGIFTLDWGKAWNGIKDIFSGIWDTISSVVRTPMNTVLAIFEGFINKVIDGWNWLKKQINKFSIQIPDWLGGGEIGFNLQMSGYVSLPRFSNGGFPEDGLFLANHNELIGKFNNGNTVVANNIQITKGIEEAAYRGYKRAIYESGMNTGISNEIDVHVHTDEGTVIDRIERRTKQTGVFPFTIPTN